MIRKYFFVMAIFLSAGCAAVNVERPEKPLDICTDPPELEAEAQSYVADAQLAEETPELVDYLEYAALNSPALEAAFYRWKASLEAIPEVRALPDPRFTYTYFIEEVETRVGPQQQKFAVAQNFPWFGKLELKGEAAFQASEVKRLEYQRVKTSLFYEIKSHYYDLYYLSRAVDIARENMNLVRFLESIARSGFTTGTSGHGDVIKAQVELGRLEERIQSLEDRFEPVRAQFNKCLNRPTDARVSSPTGIDLMEISMSEQDLLALLAKNNPQLRGAEFVANKEKLDIDIAKKNYYPDVTFGLEYVDTGPARMPTSDSGKDPVMAMVSMNLPVWRTTYRAMEEKARNEYAAALNDRKALENDLVAKMKLILYDFRDAKRKVDLYGNALIPKARETLQVQQQAFTVGRSTFLDLLDSQRVLLEFQLEREKALTVQAQKVAELEMLLASQVGQVDSQQGKS